MLLAPFSFPALLRYRHSKKEYILWWKDKSKAMVFDIFLRLNILQDPVETEKRFAKRILSVVDYNEDGQLFFSEFSHVILTFGYLVAAIKVLWL